MDTIIPLYFVKYTVFIEDIFKIIILAFNMFINNFLIILKKFEKRRLNFNFILLD